MSQNSGVRGRLLLAFLGISAFVVLAVFVAMYSFLQVDKAFDRITTNRLPSTISSQQLSRQAERLVALAPAILSVKTDGEHSAITSSITQQLSLLHQKLDELHTLETSHNQLDRIEDLVFQLSINLSAVDTMVFNRLALTEHKTRLLKDLSFTDLSSRRLLTPGLVVMDAKLAELRGLLEAKDDESDIDSTELNRLAQPIVRQLPMQVAVSQVFIINETLLKAAVAESALALEVLRFPLRRALDDLNKSLAEIEAGLSQRLTVRLEEFEKFSAGKNSIPRIRKLELDQVAQIRHLLDQNKSISHQLTQAVDQLVSEAIRDIGRASEEALLVQHNSTLIMVAVAIASILSATLIVILYVDQSLIKRLTRLSDSMKLIAGGNLETPIQTSGDDEISRMASALEVFRDTARELQESNLKEIQATRQRLADAIESVDEAFSLYDSDERLLLCNDPFRNIFSRIGSLIEPGVQFELIIRRAIEVGMIKIHDESPEEWLQKRLQNFRRKQGAELVELWDGRHLQISESSTSEGGTVAIYADATKLVNQAEDLERWNRGLEKRIAAQVKELHNIEQLKRYFPPQLTDAIVSDNQDTLLEDHRREISVVFCDLRGFTEFSSLAEPEEEMRVIREYHQVVCTLIFQYGATLEHFAGDGVMAFLNDPIPHPDHAERSIKMAVAMRDGMNLLREQWEKREIDLGFGIGIGTGFATLGRIGTPQQFHYAAIGSVANLAARLCDQAKHNQILVSKSVKSAVKGDFDFEPVGELTLKGFQKPIATFNVITTT